VLTSDVNANLYYCTNHLEPNLLVTSWQHVDEAVEQYYLVDTLRPEMVGLSEVQWFATGPFHLVGCHFQNSVCHHTTMTEEEVDSAPATVQQVGDVCSSCMTDDLAGNHLPSYH
jgi:hypothetical protein